MVALTIACETPDQPEVLAFLAASDAFAAGLYPAESNHMLDIDALKTPSVRFFVARRAGSAVGCGAVVIDVAPWAEIKRMWVDPAGRGAGVGRAILTVLEAEARRAGLSRLCLETGIHNHEAIAHYRRAGFTATGPFGSYGPDPLSVFMHKMI